MSPGGGLSRWLDSLARRAAHGQSAPLPIISSPASDESGIPRRTVLQAAAGAALVAAPLRLLSPAIAAGAITDLQSCRDDNFKRSYDAFQACVKDPMDALSAAQDAMASEEDHLAHVNELPAARRAAARKRLRKNIARAVRDRDRAIQKLEKCNVNYFNELEGGEFDCRQGWPPTTKSPGGTGGTSGGTTGGCDPGYLLCGDYCCNLAYATCTGCNGMAICCRINGNCCNTGG
jgi:hypothetical protein